MQSCLKKNSLIPGPLDGRYPGEIAPGFPEALHGASIAHKA
jgi:hypothetical protein